MLFSLLGLTEYDVVQIVEPGITIGLIHDFVRKLLFYHCRAISPSIVVVQKALLWYCLFQYPERHGSQKQILQEMHW